MALGQEPEASPSPPITIASFPQPRLRESSPIKLPQLSLDWPCGRRSWWQRHPDPLNSEVRFYKEIRVWMAKYDAEDRQSRGEPIPEEIQRLLGQLIAESAAAGDVLDIYDAAFSERLTELMNKDTNQQLTRPRSSPS
ncbi:MAG: type I restriction enzyme endonuclease domain-containing protein [Pseudonocardiaceae bacterium]